MPESVPDTLTVVSDADAVPHSTPLNSLASLLLSTSHLTVKKSVELPECDEKAAHLPTVENFILNFLHINGYPTALAAFQSELTAKSLLPRPDSPSAAIPSIYLQLQELQQQHQVLLEELEKLRHSATAVHSLSQKLVRERDFHKSAHSRVVQERQKILSDLRRLRAHYQQYEPTLTELKHKYETVIKEKFLLKLEKDKLQGKLAAVAATSVDVASSLEPLDEAADKPPDASKPPVVSTKRPFASWPKAVKSSILPAPTALRGSLRCSRQVSSGVATTPTSLSPHPQGALVAVGLSAGSFKLLTIPGLTETLEAQGHAGYVSKVAIEKTRGSLAVTASGADGTVKLWDLAKESCVENFQTTHSGYGVLGLDFHWGSSALVATASVDHTAKVLDLSAGRVRQTLRGHVDAVNAVVWQPGASAVLATASADKTVSIWDVRSGLGVQTFYGSGAVSGVAWGAVAAAVGLGSVIATAELSGVVRIWDMRKCAELARVQLPPGVAVNAVCFDASGSLLALAGADGRVRVVDANQGVVVATGEGHEGEVADVVWLAGKAGGLLTAGADGTVRMWGQ